MIRARFLASPRRRRNSPLVGGRSYCPIGGFVVDPVSSGGGGAAIGVFFSFGGTAQGKAVAVQGRSHGDMMIRVSMTRLAAIACASLTLLTAANAGATTTAAATAVTGTATAEAELADVAANQQFRSLFMTWKKLDATEQPAIAIPSAHPVEALTYTSNFGVRSDPFHGGARMHAGVDISGPVGTPIYATADGVVGRAERSGGYGNLVELEHGKGIQTRYGHLSKILVVAGDRIRRGQLIALMGSTGRSTGSHLHYEVRMDGHAVNPAPFLQTANYLLTTQDRALQPVAVTSMPIASSTGR